MICLGNIQEPRLLSLDSVWSPCATRCVGGRRVGGKKGYRDVFFGIRNDGKGSEKEGAANLHKLDCVLPNYLDFCLVI